MLDPLPSARFPQADQWKTHEAVPDDAYVERDDPEAKNLLAGEDG